MIKKYINKNILILLFFLILSSCSSNSWTWFVYRYWVSSESTWEIKWGFRSLEDCKIWVYEILPNNSIADYECWKNCKYNSSYWMNICEETVQ